MTTNLTSELQKQIEQEAKSSAADFNYYPGSEECDDLESAHVTGASRYAVLWQQSEAKAARYEKALKDIMGANDLVPPKHEMIAIAREALTPKQAKT